MISSEESDKDKITEANRVLKGFKEEIDLVKERAFMPFFRKPTQGLPYSRFQPIKPFCEALNFSFPPLERSDTSLGVGYDQSPFLRNIPKDPDMFIMLKDILEILKILKYHLNKWQKISSKQLTF